MEIGSAPAFSLYITMYEYFKRKEYIANPSFNHFVSGFCAEAVSGIVWLPIDVVKERLQVYSFLKKRSKKTLEFIITLDP